MMLQEAGRTELPELEMVLQPLLYTKSAPPQAHIGTMRFWHRTRQHADGTLKECYAWRQQAYRRRYVDGLLEVVDGSACVQGVLRMATTGTQA
jgi:hypothetical protein